jgi:uncharacterized RDD family membrane protein YckC
VAPPERCGRPRRAAAALVDGVLAGGLQVLATLVVLAADGRSPTSALGDPGTAIVLAVCYVPILVVYHLLFELMWAGTSPGKRIVGAVVTGDDGLPPRTSQVVVRNLLRAVDLLPVAYLCGGLLVLGRRQQRIGDLVAGTVVARSPLPVLAEGALAAEVGGVAHRRLDEASPVVRRALAHIGDLSPAEADSVRRYVQGRSGLSASSRRELARRLSDGLWPRFPSLSPRECPDPDVFLSVIYAALSTSRPGAHHPSLP